MYRLQKHFILLRTIFNHRFPRELNPRHRFVYPAGDRLISMNWYVCPFRWCLFTLLSLTLRSTVLPGSFWKAIWKQTCMKCCSLVTYIKSHNSVTRMKRHNLEACMKSFHFGNMYEESFGGFSPLGLPLL